MFSVTGAVGSAALLALEVVVAADAGAAVAW